MTDRLLVAVMAFALGVLARDWAQDFRDPRPVEAAAVAVFEPEPALEGFHRLAWPLACDHEWIRVKVDLGPWRERCTVASTPDARSRP